MAEILPEQAPRKARELFDKGFAAFERGNIDYAMDMFTAALEIEPRFLQARKFLRAASVKKFRDKKGGAVTHMVSSLAGAATLTMAMTQVGKKPLQALKMAEKLLRMDPLNLSFINLLVKAAETADMPEVAIQSLEVAKDGYPGNVKVLNDLARLYQKVNRMRDARICYEEVSRLRPNDPKAIKTLKDAAALDTMQKGGWSEASSYRDVMKDAKEATLLEQGAKAVKSDKDMTALIDEMRAKLEREPENMNYVRSLADLLTRAERYDEALDILSNAQKTMARGDPQIERAVSAIQAKKFDGEIAALEAAGDAQGAEAKRQEKDGFLVANAGEQVKRYPNDLQFRYEYGLLLFQRGRLNEAIEEFQLAQRNPQRRIRTLYYMALCFKQKKQYDIAMEQLEKAAAELHVMDDTKKDIFYEMGSIFELMGNPQKAAQHFKEIYSVDIRYKDVAEKIEKAYSK